MSDPHTWEGVVGWTLVYTAVAWAVIFLARAIFAAPFHLYREQKDRADKLEQLRQVANDASRPPSFDIGFEMAPIDQEQIDTFDAHNHVDAYGRAPFLPFDTQEVCRIWVENLEHFPIADCRVVIEDFHPDAPIKKGVLLIEDSRGADNDKGADFRLAATEKRYFKFLRLTKPLYENDLVFAIKSDQDRTGLMGIFDKAPLTFGQRYFAAIAAHGDGANSRRINLIIEPISKREIRINSNEPQKENAKVSTL